VNFEKTEKSRCRVFDDTNSLTICEFGKIKNLEIFFLIFEFEKYLITILSTKSEKIEKSIIIEQRGSE